MFRLRSVRSRLLRKPTLGFSVLTVTACVLVASVARWILGEAANSVPFVSYYPAIVLCTLLAGWRAGAMAIFVSMALVNTLFMRPQVSVTQDWHTAATMTLFVLSCGLLVAIAQTLRVTVVQLQAATDRAEYLNQELLHRVRNSLTVVNALAAMTFKAEPANFIPVFSKRMGALAGGLDVLSLHDGQECDLHAMINQACAPFAEGSRITVMGSTGMLPSQVCIPLMLGIHELCTNAVKYGALSVVDGEIRIETEWDVANGVASVTWQESGGPTVTLPERRGLGSALLADPLLGPATVTFEPHGLRCELRLKIAS